MSNGAGTVQQIKDKLSIVDVVSQYVKLERAGGALRARCPFHAERSPSFHVSPDRGTYHCFGCGVGGDIFSFVEAIEGLDFKGALRVLAEKAGVQITYEKPQARDSRERLFEILEVATIYFTSRLNEPALKYLHDRGLTDPTIQSFRLGWAGDAWSDLSEYLKVKKYTEAEIIEAGLAKKSERGSLTDKFRNRIIFPIADSAGRIVGFSARIFGENASPEAPKYLNSPETPLFHKSKILYGFDRAKMAIRKLNCAVLVEGQMDLLASHEAGWSNTVAVSGTAFTQEHANLIKRMTENLVIALDADQAGIKAAGKAARAALQSGMNVKVAKLPTGSDPADLILKEGVEAWRTAIRDSKDIITFLLDVLYEHAPEQDKFRRNVEAVVLPFLSDVQSPIAREQYVHEIARRLNVSESAVTQAFDRVPHERSSDVAPTKRADSEKVVDPSAVADRVRQAFALLVWQESLPTKLIDVVAFERELKESIGETVLADLRALPAAEIESLRFMAEMIFGNVGALQQEVTGLAEMLLKERLRAELSLATTALQAAESRNDDEEIARLMGVCKLLTDRLAHVPKSV